MYYFRDTGGDLLALAITLMLALIFLTVRACVFVAKTFLTYYQHKALWIALAVCVVLTTCGVLLSLYVNQAYEALAYIGFAVLLITCKAVEMRNSDTLMPEKSNGFVNSTLHRSWFASEDDPVEELAA